MGDYFDQFDEPSKPAAAPASENFFNRFDKPDDTGDVARGFKTAFQQVPQLGYGLAGITAAALESALGDGGVASAAKQWAVRGYQDWGARIAAGAKDTDEFDVAYDRAKQGDFGALVDWLQYGVGYSVGQFLQVAGTAGVGAVAGRIALKPAVEHVAAGLVAKQAEKLIAGGMAREVAERQAVATVAAQAGALAATGAQAFGMEGGEIGGDLSEKSVKENRSLTGTELARAAGATALAGMFEFAGDAVGLGAMLGKAPVGKALAGMTGLKGRAARGVVAGAMVAPVEGATEYMQTGAEEFGKGNEANILPWKQSEESQRQALNAAALGAVGGAVMGGGGGVMTAPKAPEPAPDDPGTVRAVQRVAAAPDVDTAIAEASKSIDEHLAEATLAESTPGAPYSALLREEDGAGLVGSILRRERENAAFADRDAQLAKQKDAELEAMVAGQREAALPPEDGPSGLRQPFTAPEAEPPKNSAMADAMRTALERKTLRGLEEMASKGLIQSEMDAPTVDEGAHEAAVSPENDHPEPSAAQILAGNAKLGHTKLAGMDLSIENPAGSVREDKANVPPKWRTDMQHHYGYIKGTVAFDKDHLDVFVKPETPQTWNGIVYVVNQNKGDGKFDEHKAMVGFGSEAEARDAYLANYEKGWEKRIRSIAPMPLDEFKAWAYDKSPAGPKGGPLAHPGEPKPEQRPVPSAPGQSGSTALAAPALTDGGTKAGSIPAGSANLPAVKQQLYVERGGQRFPVASLQEAAEKWGQFFSAAIREGAGGSGGSIGGAKVVDQDGKEVARISQNGRVWPPGEWKAGMKPLLTPASEQRTPAQVAEHEAFVKQAKDEAEAEKRQPPRKLDPQRLIKASDVARQVRGGKQPWEVIWQKAAESHAAYMREAFDTPANATEDEAEQRAQHLDYIESALERGDKVPRIAFSGHENIDAKQYPRAAAAQAAANPGASPEDRLAAEHPKLSSQIRQALKAGVSIDRVRELASGPEARKALLAEVLAKKKKPGLQMEKAPPGGWTEADKVPRKAPESKPVEARPAELSDEDKAKEEIKAALADLGDLLGKNTRLNITPEQEQKLLPIMTRLFDAAFRLGHIKFKAAARFVREQITKALGKEAADELTLEHYQGGYIAMSGRYRDKGADKASDVAAVDTLDEEAPAPAGATAPASQWQTPGPMSMGAAHNVMPTGTKVRLSDRTGIVQPRTRADGDRMNVKWDDGGGSVLDGRSLEFMPDSAPAEKPAEPSQAATIATALRTAAETIEKATAPAPAEPAPAEQAAPAAEERKKDSDGNPIYKKGERVEFVEGYYAGRHGEIKVVAPITMRTIMLFGGGPGTESTSYSYEVKTDGGAVVHASPRDLKFETAKPENVAPDIDINGQLTPPARVLQSAVNARNSANNQRASAARARKPSVKADWMKTAAQSDYNAEIYQKAFDEWAEKYPDDARALRGEPKAAAAAPATTEGTADLPAMSMVESVHTKTKERIWVVNMVKREPYDVFKAMEARANSMGGFYNRSRFGMKGYTFKSEAKAREFMGQGAAAAEEAPQPRVQGKDVQLPGSPYVYRRESNGVWTWRVGFDADPVRATPVKPAPQLLADLEAALDGKEQIPPSEPVITPQDPAEEVPRAEPLSYEAKAQSMWDAMDESARAGVRHGVYPSELMTEATGQGYSAEGLATFLNDVAAKMPDAENRPILKAEESTNVPEPRQPAQDDSDGGAGRPGQGEALPEEPGRPERAGGSQGDRGRTAVSQRDGRNSGVGDQGAQPDAGERPDGRGALENPVPERPSRSSPRASGRIPGGSSYVAAPGSLTRKGSWLDTAKRNVAIIALVKKLEAEGRWATSTEQALIAQYTGFGASEIANGLFPVKYEHKRVGKAWKRVATDEVDEDALKPGWKEVYRELRDILTPEEISTVKTSTQYAHYTSEGIIRSIWAAAERLGFKGGKIVEPGMGTGLFMVSAPEAIAKASRYVGIEMDHLTAAIAKQLLQTQNVIRNSYIDQNLPNNQFDAAFGNPPFASWEVLADPAYRKNSFKLHDYFFAKTIDKVRPGGILAFVTSRGTMDKQDDAARKYLAERADFIGAIRLPETAFMANAGTEVVTDVIFLQKREPGAKPGGKSWLELKEVTTPEGPTKVNEYFADNPQMVLGRHSLDGSMYRSNMYTVKPNEGSTIEEQFAEAVESLPEGVYREFVAKSPAEIHESSIQQDFDVQHHKEGGLYVAENGELMQVVNGVGVPLAKKLSDNERAWLKDYVPLRDAVKVALRDQVEDGQWEKSQKELQRVYKAFVKTHGRILAHSRYERQIANPSGDLETRVYRRFKWGRVLSSTVDTESSLVEALEKLNDANTDIADGDILKHRLLAKPAPAEIKGPQDAVAVSMNELGRFDLEDIAKRLNLSTEEAIPVLGDMVYESPGEGWQLADEYLSGNVLKKLQEAEAAASLDDRYTRNVQALIKVQPAPLGPDRIIVRLGANWIAPDIVTQFAREALEEDVQIDYEPRSNVWTVPGSELRRTREAGAKWGTKDRSGLEILSAILNNKSLTVKRTEDLGGGKSRTYVDKDATALVNDIAERMRSQFASWIWTDAARTDRLLEVYNRSYNNLAPRSFDGSHLTLPGLSLRYKLYPHQLRAIWRTIQTGNTYYAHAVGAGKTLEMIVSAMEQKRLGLIRKPMFTVPNHMLEQFANEFRDAYPSANVLVADEENFIGDERRRFVAKAALNNWDAIVIKQSSFKLIGMGEEAVSDVADDILSELQSMLHDVDKEDRTTRKRLEAQIEAVNQRVAAASGSGKDKNLTFEQLGVDFLYVDEAHTYRKLDYATDRQVKGIDPNGSLAAFDLFVKLRYLHKKRPGRSVVMASGTPVTNTLAELYTVQRFMDYDGLQADLLHHFDAWANMFGEVRAEWERNAAGQYEKVERFSRFVNVPELMMRVRQFMDVLTMEQLGHLVKRPNLAGNKPEMRTTQQSEALAEYMGTELMERLRISKEWKPSKDQPHNPDPVINIATDGRLAALDLRFVRPASPNDPDSKLNKVADAIIATYKATKGNVYTTDGKPDAIKGSTQIVFSVLGFGDMVEKTRGFSGRKWLVNRLKEGGIPSTEIAFMGDYKTDAQKEAMFKDMREGRKRVLIGSPANMGTGVNVQKRLKELHFLTPPWFPSDVEQPHGRILRQGNQNDEVNIGWYVTEGTYDSTMWGMVRRKGQAIEQAFRGDGARAVEDISEVSQYAMAEAIASGDNRVIQLSELQGEVEKLERLKNAHFTEQQQLRYKIGELESTARFQRKQEVEAEKAIEARGEFESWKPIKVSVGGREYEKAGEFGLALKDKVTALFAEAGAIEKRLEIGQANGSPVVANYFPKDKKHPAEVSLYLKFGDARANMGYKLNAEQWAQEDPVEMGKAVRRALEEPDDRLRRAQNAAEEAEAELKRIRPRLGTPFERAADLASKIAEAAELHAQLIGESVKKNAELEAARKAREAATSGTEDDADAPNFARSGAGSRAGITETALREAVAEAFGQRAADRLIGNIIIPLADQSKLPAHVVPYVRAGDTIYGFHDPKTDKTYAVLSNLTRDMVRGLVMHEVGVHYGFEKMLGKEKYDQVMKRLDAMARAGNKAVKDARAIAEKEAAAPSMVPEETLAYLVTNSPQLGVIKEILAAIRAFLYRQFGLLADSLTVEDITALARGSVQAAGIEEGRPAFMPAFARNKGTLVAELGTLPNLEAATGKTVRLGGPIRLFSDGAGHIWEGDSDGGAHADELRRLGYASPEGYARDVVDRFTRVFRAPSNQFVLLVDGDRPRALFVENDQDVWVVQGGFAPHNRQVRSKLKSGEWVELKAGSHPAAVSRKQPAFPAAPSESTRGTHIDSGKEGESLGPTQKPVKSTGTDEPGNFMRSGIAGSTTMGDYRDSIAAGAASFVRDLMHSDAKMGWWARTIGTQQHKAATNAEFKPVYDEGQAFLADVSKYANEAADAAADLLPRIEGLRDFAKKPPSTEDVENVTQALYAGTLFGGGSPLKGRVWTDEELRAGRGDSTDFRVRDFAPLTDRQITLYRQTLESVGRSLDGLAKSLLHKLARQHGIGFDREMSLEDVAAVLRDKVDDAIAEYEARLEAVTDKDRIDQQAADIAEMNDNGRPGAAQRAVEQFRRAQAAEAESVEAAIAELEKLKEAIDDIEHKTAGLKRRGYFPAMRFGQYAVHVVERNSKGEPVQRFFGLFESQTAANLAARDLAKEYPDAQIHRAIISKEQHKLFQGLSLDTLEAFADHISGTDGKPISRDPLVQGFLKAAVAERSVLKRHIHRKGVAGYSKDLPRVLASFTVSTARATSSNYHAAEMDRLANAIKAGDVKDEAINLVRYLKDPIEEAQAIRGFLFAQFLGGSIAHGLVNMTQPFMVTVPYLTQYTSVADAAKKLGEAMTTKPESLTGRIRAAYERAKKEGVVAPQEIHQLRAETGGMPLGRSLTMRKVSMLWGSIYAITEQFNRTTSFLAAYRIAEEKGIADPYTFAADAVNETQFVYNKGNRPNWARGALGATVFTFKQFSIAYLELAKRVYAKDKKAFALMALMLLAAAGLEGAPFAEDVEDIIDSVGQWMGYATNSKKKLRQWATALLGKDLAQVALKGVSGLPWMPVDVSVRMGLQNLIPGTAMLKPSEKNKARDVLELAGPLGQFVPTEDTMLGRALERLATGDLFGAVKAGAPVAVQNIAKGAEILDRGYATDTKGKKITAVSPGEAVLKMAGLQPASVARESAKVQEARQDIDMQKRMESEIAEQWARGQVDDNKAEVQAAIKKLAEWNRDNPELRIRVTMDQIRRRMKEMRTTREERFVKSAPPEIRQGVRESLRQ